MLLGDFFVFLKSTTGKLLFLIVCAFRVLRIFILHLLREQNLQVTDLKYSRHKASISCFALVLLLSTKECCNLPSFGQLVTAKTCSICNSLNMGVVFCCMTTDVENISNMVFLQILLMLSFGTQDHVIPYSEARKSLHFHFRDPSTQY